MKFTSDIVIGLEVHIELDTDSKLFCGCKRAGDKDEQPNTRTCQVCLGHPGSKPVLNKKAVEYAIKLALATKSKISPELIFSRKSYFYPDMSKNFQISQYEVPLAVNGNIKLAGGKEIRLTRIHMEEDPAALVHIGSMEKSPYVLVDYNRSGDPLVEVVTEPDMSSAEEARDFMKQLITILSYLEIFDINSCIIKADANISIKESNYTRVEVKNITGFKEIERALKYEIERQKEAVRDRVKIKPETRAWDSEKGISFALREKETEADYGYIIEPDLPVIEISREWVEKIKKGIPELAAEKLEKYEKLTKQRKIQSMAVIVKDPKLAKFFENVISDKEINPKLASHWVELELKRVLNYNKKNLDDAKIKPENIIDLIRLIQNKRITEQTGRRLIEKLVEKEFDVDEYVKKQGLEIISDKGEIEKYCREAVKENPEAVENYKKGEEKALHFIIGQVMKKSKGKASPNIVKEIILKILE